MAEEKVPVYPTLSEQDIFDLRRTFSNFVNDSDGLVDAKDLPALFKSLEQEFPLFAVKEDELKTLLERNSIVESDSISFSQFLTLIAYKLNEYDDIEELQEAYFMFDTNNTGFITSKDLLRVMQHLGENITEAEAQEMMRQADRDSNGRITFSEFIDMIRYAQVI